MDVGPARSDDASSSVSVAELLENVATKKLIGKGGHSYVYSVEVPCETARVLALKVEKKRTSPKYAGYINNEVRMLKKIGPHPNIVEFLGGGDFKRGGWVRRAMLMGLYEIPLWELPLTTETPRIEYARQLLAAVAFCHSRGVAHHDIKPMNILLRGGQLALCDFGIATDDPTECEGVTLWWRPPEFLLGWSWNIQQRRMAVEAKLERATQQVDPELLKEADDVERSVGTWMLADEWSAGVVILELYAGRPMLMGNNEIHQLELICEMRGTPSEKTWPGVLDNSPDAELDELEDKPGSSIKETIERGARNALNKLSDSSTRNPPRADFRVECEQTVVDVLESLLICDPRQRLTAEQALAILG